MLRERKFQLSRDRVLWGVCGGIAEWYGLEKLFVRMFFFMTAAACVFIPGIIIYVVLWAFMAKADAKA